MFDLFCTGLSRWTRVVVRYINRHDQIIEDIEWYEEDFEPDRKFLRWFAKEYKVKRILDCTAWDAICDWKHYRNEQ